MRRIAICMMILSFTIFAASVVFAARVHPGESEDAGYCHRGGGVRCPAYGFREQKGRGRRVEIDLVKAIAKKLGVKIQFVQAITKTRIPLLVNRNVDLVIRTMTHTRERDQVIDFTMHYYIATQSFITRKDSGITKIAQLAGKKVAGAQGGTSVKNLAEHRADGANVKFSGAHRGSSRPEAGES